MIADGARVYLDGFAAGIAPDPVLWVDEWSDQFMRIPRGNGAETGRYKTSRTPYAREVMRCLSPEHPAKRVVAMVGSQLFKTQVGLNWISASIHRAPGNILALLPTQGLAKRVSGRIGKTIDSVPELRDTVATPRSRDARNTIDTKEFAGGTLYISTAGSASNLAEIPARYLYGDEVDRWEASVDGEGDPVELAETRTSTFGRNAKIYYTSTPTIEGQSRIAELFLKSDQRWFYVPCPHCDHFQTLEFERLNSSDGDVQYMCVSCAALIQESAKNEMLHRGEWRPHSAGDGETVGFTLSGLYAPFGWTSWGDLYRQHSVAKALLSKGDSSGMQVFYNTRLAKTWDDAQERIKPDELKGRAESYRLRTAPEGCLILTAAVDVQHNRLEVMIVGWGVDLERWIVDFQAIYGDPSAESTWDDLDALLKTGIPHTTGAKMDIVATAIDSGGHHTHEVYQFCRSRRHVLAIKGASSPGKPVIAARPRKLDIKWQGDTDKKGAELWLIGTDTAKDWLYSRWKIPAGPGGIHFSSELTQDFYDQIVSEKKLVKYVKGHKRTEWVKARADRNEALDLSVYNLACAHYLGLHKFNADDWTRWSEKLTTAEKFIKPKEIIPEPITKPKPRETEDPDHWKPRGAGYKPRRR